MDVFLPVKVEIKAVIIRADGTRENLGTINSYSTSSDNESEE